MENIELKQQLKEKLEQLNLQLSDKQLDLLLKYKNLVLEWNQKINLTAIKEDEEFINKHLVDSLTICKYIEEGSKMIDIGTGAGFPRIPVKIAKNNDITLFDSLKLFIISPPIYFYIMLSY